MRGLISGVLGGVANAVDEIASGQIKTNQFADLKGQMAQMELEKRLRIDEVTRNRDIADIGRRAEATAAAAPALAQGEAEAFIGQVNTPGFLGAHRELAAAKAPPVRGPSGIRGEIETLLRELSNTTDPQQREELRRRINDLSGADSAAGVRETLAQQVAAARAILSDIDATDQEKANARAFLSRVTEDAMEKRGGSFERTPTSGPIDGPWNKYR